MTSKPHLRSGAIAGGSQPDEEDPHSAQETTNQELVGMAEIRLRRSPLRTAPERIFFEVALGGFETTGPDQAGGYNPQLHDLIYIWEFGDPGARFTSPLKVLAEWRDANVAYGPTVCHVFETPKDYTVTVTVIEPDTGRTAVASTTFTVDDPDITFAGRRTLCVAQDGTVERVPENALVLNSLSKALALTNRKSSPYRIILKRGETWDWDSFEFFWWSPSIHIVAEPGTGARPVLRTVEPADRTRGPFFNHRLTENGREYVYQGLHFDGGWDSRTETGYPDAGAIKVEDQAKGHILVSDCHVTGMGGAGFAGSQGPGTTEDMHFSKSFVVHQTSLTNWRGIGHFAVGAARYALLGCSFVCDPDAKAGGNTDKPRNYLGPLRFQPKFAHLVVIDGCEFFNRVGWFPGPGGDHTVQQPCLRWNQSMVPGAILNCQRSSFEGGFQLIALQGMNGRVVETVQNVLIDRCIFVGSHHSNCHIASAASGMTIRNCLAVVPNVPRQHPNYEPRAFVLMDGIPEEGSLVGPIKIYNNTILNLLAETNSHDGNPAIMVVQDMFSMGENLIVENNLLHQPNIPTPDVEHHPLSEEILWVPREKGYISDATPQLLTQYRSPFDTVQMAKPLEGSTALGAATEGEVSYLDILGRKRPAYPSIGAFEMD